MQKRLPGVSKPHRDPHEYSDCPRPSRTAILQPTRPGKFSVGNLQGLAIDVADTHALRDAVQKGKRAFILDPPASPTLDTDAEETRTGKLIADALSGSGLEKVVAASTYGAQPGKGIGDLLTLYAFEKMVAATGVPAAINRGAYYFTNLDAMLDAAKTGEMQTPFPRDLRIPMVSPIDLAKAAAARLSSSVEDIGGRYVEGLARYRFDDVAAAFSRLLGKSVELAQIPREEIEQSFRSLGFSRPAAEAYTRMTLATIDDPDLPADPDRGSITLEQYLSPLVAAQ